ncbi:MAG: hypothetical protein ACLU9S_12200 [Oscillospiraceae bacterium]
MPHGAGARCCRPEPHHSGGDRPDLPDYDVDVLIIGGGGAGALCGHRGGQRRAPRSWS